MGAEKFYDVIVVGAGLSGLSAAATAYEAGLSVLVLEALDRVGGKVLSASDPTGGKGHPDLGAAWINDTSQSHMWALAQKFGIETQQQAEVGDTIMELPDGEVIRIGTNTLPGTPEEQMQLLQLIALVDDMGTRIKAEEFTGPLSQALDKQTFKAWVQQQSDDPLGVIVANYLVQAIVGTEASEVSALYILKYVEAATGFINIAGTGKDGGQYLRAKQGMSAFPHGLAALLPSSSILLSTPVSSITQNSTHCIITATTTTESQAQPQTYHASKVIISISTPLYKHITFSPPLPSTKQTIISSTKLGYYTKLIAIYSSPWWRDAGLIGQVQSLDSSTTIKMVLDTSVDSQSQYSLSLFIVGEPGRRWAALATDEERETVALEHLEKLFGPFLSSSPSAGARGFNEQGSETAGTKNSIPKPAGLVTLDWSKEKWIEGAPSSLYGVGTLTGQGQEKSQDVINGTAVLKEVFGKLHFVGTEMSVMWEGYMEGAVREGERGGKEVIEALKMELSG